MKGKVIKMITIDRIKKLATGLVAVAAFAIILSSSAVSISADVDDAAVTYKAKCAMCHGANVEKAFDAAKGDDALIEVVLKGVKPKMPAYEGKLTADQAKGLVAYMKTLRK